MDDLTGFRDPIFRGCTRPAMFAGIPMVPFMLTSGAFLLLAVWTFYLLSPYVSLCLLLIYVPIVVWMRHATKQDDQRLRQIMMRARMRFRQRASRELWGAISFSPIRYKRRKKA